MAMLQLTKCSLSTATEDISISPEFDPGVSKFSHEESGDAAAEPPATAAILEISKSDDAQRSPSDKKNLFIDTEEKDVRADENSLQTPPASARKLPSDASPKRKHVEPLIEDAASPLGKRIKLEEPISPLSSLSATSSPRTLRNLSEDDELANDDQKKALLSSEGSTRTIDDDDEDSELSELDEEIEEPGRTSEYEEDDENDEDVQKNRIQHLEKTWPERPEQPGRGLLNVGGTRCYRNSLLQALFHLPQMVNLLKDHCEKDSCKEIKLPPMASTRRNGRAEKDLEPKISCIACALRILLDLYWSPKVDPKHENLLNDHMKMIDNLITRSGWKSDTTSEHSDPEEHLRWIVENLGKIDTNFTKLYDALAQFKLVSIFRCNACDNESRNSGELVDTLQLALCQGSPAQRLEDSISAYMSETIPERECGHCQRKGESLRVQEISTPPDMLIATINRIRLEQTKRGNQVQVKSDDPVEYPKTLDLTSFAGSQQLRRLRYALKSVISHRGSPSSGHYICCTQNTAGKWQIFDDLTSEVASIDEALHPAVIHQSDKVRPFTAHMLFYQRM